MKQTSFVLFLMIVSFCLGWHFACESDPDCTDKTTVTVSAPRASAPAPHVSGKK